LPGAPNTLESRELTPNEIRRLLESGTDAGEVAARLVETGCWSESGAAEIVAFLTRGPDVLMKLDLTKRQESTSHLRRSVSP
jgi:hypothetical protein